MKKDLLIYISRGHDQMTNAGVVDPGAVSGKFVEAELAETACGYLREYLIANRGNLPFKVAYPERHGDGMHIYEHVNEIEAYRKKYRTVFFDWHFNAGGGTGCECHVKKGNKYSIELAELILEEQKKIGRPWHSWDGKMETAILERTDLLVMEASGPVLLFEAGYVDNKTDRKDFDTNKELKEIAYAVGRAFIRYAEKYA